MPPAEKACRERRTGSTGRPRPASPKSPLGEQVAHAQPDGIAPGGHYGYNFRLLYAQGPVAPGGALDDLVNGRMSSFAAIAWPARYGETGIMTFMVNHDGVIYQRDLGPETHLLAPAITRFDPRRDGKSG